MAKIAVLARGEHSLTSNTSKAPILEPLHPETASQFDRIRGLPKARAEKLMTKAQRHFAQETRVMIDPRDNFDMDFVPTPRPDEVDFLGLNQINRIRLRK